jgi:hypothetical protein
MKKTNGERMRESTDDKPHAINDLRHEGVAWSKTNPPFQSIDMKSRTIGSQASRGKDPYKDKRQVIMIIQAKTRIKDGNDYHYRKAMIGRTRSQQKKLNKRDDSIKNCNQKEHNHRDYHIYKDGERKNCCKERYRMNN